MANFMHLADERDAKRIKRNGIRAAKSGDGKVTVFCVPVVPNFQTTFQWSRELRRDGYRSTCAIQFRIPDSELVTVGRYGQQPSTVTAAEAVRIFLSTANTAGFEVRIARAITPREITHVRAAPYLAGWRFAPEAKGNPPYWPIWGIKSRRLRDALHKKE